MATVNYYLNNKENSKGERLILLYFRYSKKQVVVSTNDLIQPAHWDSKNQRATAKHIGYSSLNNNLQQYKAELIEIFNNRKYHKLSLLPADLKTDFEKIIKPTLFDEPTEEEAQLLTLVGFMNSQIKEITHSKNNNTLKTYKRCRDILESFEKEIWKRKLLFKDIDLDFYLKWKEFIIVNYSFRNNSINKHTGIIKLFMGEAADRNLHQNFIYRSKKFNTPREEVDSIYLNENEIDTLMNLDLSANERLERVRDLFIIGCRTGLRFSDLANLREENIISDLKYFSIHKIKKTDVSLDIPIHSDVLRILRKYKEKTGKYVPSSISNQKMNDYLKEIGQLAQMDIEIPQVVKIGNKRIQSKSKKYELITCHTARRSFATNEYLAGTPSYEIMAITGHKTEKAFLTYIKIKQKQYAHSLGERWKERDKKLKSKSS